jgi:DNA-binding MarR family transcriptional regulator
MDLTREHVAVWRSLLQLAQVVSQTLEEDVPGFAGVPPGGQDVLRLLRWHGPKTITAIADSLGIAWRDAEHLMKRLAAAALVRASGGDGASRYDLSDEGLRAVRRIIVVQRERVESVLNTVEPDHREIVATVLVQLASGLIQRSPGFETVCASCWAHDPRECVKPDAEEFCAYRVARRGEHAPGSREGTTEGTAAPASAARSSAGGAGA